MQNYPNKQTDGQSFNRLEFLTDADRNERDAMIAESQARHFQAITESLTGRLLQVRHTIKVLTDEVKRALSAGEPEESLYIKELQYKLIILITQEEELNALVGEERRAA